MPDRQDFRFEALKARQRDIRAGFPHDFGLRIHRMISWIGRAELEPDDPAAAFIFLWIAFNAAYSDGGDLDGERTGERQRFAEFFGKVLEHDFDHLLYRSVWNDEARPIRDFIDNRFVFSPFWNFQHGRGAEDWEARFESGRATFEEALQDGDTAVVLSFLFDRLYMLRNQLIHGGATWNSSVNRDQLECGVTLLGALLPAVAEIMMKFPMADWGRPFFPVVAPSTDNFSSESIDRE
ncbi:MAG: HEPN domain-containing protein [Silicimonas sp.]